ncbi:hypothetical protein CBR_g53555 [Chara braunii]|uniref:Uncharacterized protein n=1 Tax=Chara braunii TaxID=69332 RepID=A0A388MAY3_CHABU|nr:hypothetical protein CBR_g53555 [Chara braunii]|eukprot:GBG91741.1 hypothetical protein CBR_g53555 [Chara braunii]
MGWGGGDQHMGGGGGGGKHGTGAGGHDSTQVGGKSGYPRSSAGTIPPGMGARLHSGVSAVEGASSQSSAGSRLAQPTDEVFFTGGSILPTVLAEVSTMSKSLPVGNVPYTVSARSNFPCALEPTVVGSVNVEESEQRMDVDVGRLSTGGGSIRSIELLPKSQVAYVETVDRGSFRPTTDCAADVPSKSSTATCGEMPVRSHSAGVPGVHRLSEPVQEVASVADVQSLTPSGGSILQIISEARETHVGNTPASDLGVWSPSTDGGSVVHTTSQAQEMQVGVPPASVPGVESPLACGGSILPTANLIPPRGEMTKDEHTKSNGSESTHYSEDKDIIEESAEQHTTPATEVRCSGTTEVRCGDTEDDFLSQLYSGMNTAPLPAGNVLAGQSTQTFVMRPSKLPSPTLALGRCAEEREVSVSEQEKGVIRRSLGDDVVRKLFNDDEDLTVVDSSPREASSGRMALEELSLNEDVEKPRVDSLDPFAEEVFRIVDADIKDLSKFPPSLDHIVASGKMKGGGIVLGLKATCVQAEVARIGAHKAEDAAEHAGEDAVAGKQ